MVCVAAPGERGEGTVTDYEPDYDDEDIPGAWFMEEEDDE